MKDDHPVHFRTIRGPQDAEALYAIHEARIAIGEVDPLSTSEDLPTLGGLRSSLAEALTANGQDRWVVVEAEGRVVAYGRIDDWTENDGTRVYLLVGWVLPEHRGRGIGTRMIRSQEETARRLEAAGSGSAAFEFAGNASSTEEAATELLLNEGYKAGYTVLEMGWDTSAVLPDTPLPNGVQTRPVLPEHIVPIAESVGDAYRNEFDGGRFQEAYDPVKFAQLLRGPDQDPGLWQVAWAGREVAGQVMCRLRGEGKAEVFEVSVRPAWRRMMLGTALLSRALETLRRRGITVVRLHTVAEFRTRASRMYQSAGFRVLKEFPRYRKTPR